MSAQLTTLATELRSLVDEIEEKEGVVSALKTRRDAIKNKDLPEAMETAEIDKFTVDGVGTVFLQTKLYADIAAAERESAYAWLRDNGHGELIKEYVWPQTLNAFCKEQLEKGSELPEFIKASFAQQAQLRRK